MPEAVGRVKACTECRQQKVRCDAFKDYSQPCTRCRAGGLPCVISKDFQRRPRQSKAQLQHEIDRLRAQTEDGNDLQSYETSPVSLAASAESTGRKRRRRDTSNSQQNARPTVYSAINSEPSPSLREHMHPNSTPHSHVGGVVNSRAPRLWSEPTLDRTLNHVALNSSQLDHCYNAFLDHYAPYLDGLFDADVNPNDRYQQSPLLFWTMILVGSRGYQNDMTIYERLGEPVLDMIFQSCLRPTQPLAVIQAVIIFCNWPLPLDLIYKDPAHALAGAAIGLALQNGLHMYTKEQDFVVKSLQRTPRPAVHTITKRDRERDDAIVLRTRLWAYCYLVLQNTFIGDGLPPPAPTPCFRRSMLYDEILCLFPEMLTFRLRLHKLQVETLNLIANSCELEPNGCERTLGAVIRMTEEQILETPLPHDDGIHHFLRKSAQVFVLGLIFVVQREPLHQDILRLYRAARELVADAEALNSEVHNFTFYMPQSVMRIIYLAAHVLLRVPKSVLCKDLDMADAEIAVQTCIDLFTKRSIQNGDIESIQIPVLRQLWKSKKAFVRDGKPQNGLRVDMRYRLVFNPVFDNMWWWRLEFGTTTSSKSDQQKNPPLPPPENQGEQDLRQDSTNFHFPSTWSSLPPTTSSASAPYTSDMQGSMTMGDLPNDAFFGGGSMENIFDGFMDWWDFSTFPMDTFQTDMVMNDPSIPGNLGEQSLFVDPPGMTFAT